MSTSNRIYIFVSQITNFFLFSALTLRNYGEGNLLSPKRCFVFKVNRQSANANIQIHNYDKILKSSSLMRKRL